MDGLAEVFGRLDLDRLRLQRPSKTIFLCGGKLGGPNERAALSVRDFLLRHRAVFRRLNCNVVLAEAANQLYRDSRFRDLISFEEGVAQVAALILLIAESPGALAELGAFSLSSAIAPHLKVIVNQSFDLDESFIRHGPLRRLQNDHGDSVSFYPWTEVKKTGRPTKRSLARIYADISRQISVYLDASPASLPFREAADKSMHYIVYWIILLGIAMPQGKVIEAAQDFFPEATEESIVNSLYVLQMVGWVKLEAYGPYRYYYSLWEADSLDYAFTGPENARDSARFITDVGTILKAETRAPNAILRTAIGNRQPS